MNKQKHLMACDEEQTCVQRDDYTLAYMMPNRHTLNKTS